MPKVTNPINQVPGVVAANDQPDEKKGINLPTAMAIVIGAARELREDLEDGFQLRDATDFIGNVARGFHSVYGGWILSTVASLCGK